MIHVFIFLFFSVYTTDNAAFYECTLCSAKSSRKDNIRRHVRNLHSESDEELRQILKNIFDNFEKEKNKSNKDEKTEKSKTTMNIEESKNASVCANEMIEARKSIEEPIMSLNVVRNIATSVIKFVGRSRGVQSVHENEEIIAEQTKTTVYEPERVQFDQKQQSSSTANEPDSIAEIGVNLPSLEPLNFDPFPDIAPLPLINTNTNLTVYRQLLSPYLKKQPASSSENSNSKPMEPNGCLEKNFKLSSTTAMIIDRPPKKMIEKYEIYRN